MADVAIDGVKQGELDGWLAGPADFAGEVSACVESPLKAERTSGEAERGCEISGWADPRIEIARDIVGSARSRKTGCIHSASEKERVADENRRGGRITEAVGPVVDRVRKRVCSLEKPVRSVNHNAIAKDGFPKPRSAERRDDGERVVFRVGIIDEQGVDRERSTGDRGVHGVIEGGCGRALCKRCGDEET